MSEWFGNRYPSLRRPCHPACRMEELGRDPLAMQLLPVAMQLLGEWWVLAGRRDSVPV